MRYFRLSAKFKKNRYFDEKKQKKTRNTNHRTKQKLGTYEVAHSLKVFTTAKKEAKNNQKQ